MQQRGIGPAIRRGDLDEDVVRRGLGIFDLDVEVAVLREDAGVGDLVLGLVLARGGAFSRTSSLVGKRALRIFIERRVGRNGSAGASRKK